MADNFIDWGIGPPKRAPQGDKPGAARTNQYDPLADPTPGFAGGFVTSAFSAIPELFGGKALPGARAFRDEHPVAGFASQMVGTAVPYLGWARTTMLPRLAAPLESATGRVAAGLGLNIAEAPIRTGMIRETLRFLPIDVVGAAARDYGDDGVIGSNMFADIGLSIAITGALGGLGGYIRAGGRRGPQPLRVEGADLRLTPTHTLDQLMSGAQVVGEGSADDLRIALRNEILTERTARGSMSGKPLPYITTLEGATGAEDVAAWNSLFETRGRKMNQQGMRRQLLAEGDPKDPFTLAPGEQQAIVTQLGFDNIDEVARNAIFPRLITAQGDNGARALNGILQRPGMRAVGEAAFIGREPEGAFVIAKRIEHGALDSKRYGVVRPGDRWFVARTTNPGAFVPEAKQMGEQTFAAWARWRQLWQPGARSNVFDQNNDLLLRALTPQDYHDLRRMNRSAAVSTLTRRLSERASDIAVPGLRGNIRDSKSIRDAAEWIYDTFKPTMFLEHQDSRFGRFFGLMRNNVRVADNFAHRIMQGATRIKGTPSEAVRGKKVEFVSGFMGHRPVKQIVDDLTPDEVNMIAHASAGSDLPAEALKELAESGALSAKAVRAVEELQAINRDMLEQVVLPAIRDLPHTADVKWLEGYIMPRIYKGDFRVEVKNEKGDVVFLAAGKNGSAAQAEARAVVEEAATRGRNWSFDEARLRGVLDPEFKDLEVLQEQLVRRIAESHDDSAIIYQAMKKLAAIRGSTGRNPAVPTTTTALARRTGRKGSPDVHTYTPEDFLSAIDGHTRTLLRFSAMQAWKERFGQLAYSWGQNNPTLYKNLMRKSQQYLGIEGQITNVLNRTLEPVLGPVLGKKAATKIAAATNETLYNWQLALVNPTFALLNLLTPIQTVAPWVAMMTRAPSFEASKMMQFVPVYDAAGKLRGTGSVLEPLKVLREATRQLRDPEPELKQMLENAMDDGVLQAQLYEEWVGRGARASQTLRESFQQGGWVEFLRRGSTYMAEKSESYSRMVAFNSGYLVGKNHFGLQGDALYRFARRATEVTMYQYGTVDRSRIFTGPIGSMFGLFKNWQMHFIGNMANYAGLAWRQNTWSPLLWTGASATALGGLGATPLKTMADGLANWYGDSPSGFAYMQENWGEDMADTMYFGLPALLGVSLQASASIPGTDVRNETASLTSFVLMQRMKAVGKALGNAWTVQTATGENALHNPNVRDQLLAALAPRAVFRAMSSAEGDYVKSMSTGYPMAQNVSPVGRLLHGAGMNIVEVERWQVAAKELWRDQEARRSAIQGLGQAFSDAQLNGDYERAEALLWRATAQQIPVDKVIQSANTRTRREQSSDLLSRFDKDLQGRYRQFLENDQTIQPPQ